MDSLEGSLYPQRFLRVHGSTIVRLDQICMVESGGLKAIVLRDGTRLRLSLSYRPELEKRL